MLVNGDRNSFARLKLGLSIIVGLAALVFCAQYWYGLPPAEYALESGSALMTLIIGAPIVAGAATSIVLDLISLILYGHVGLNMTKNDANNYEVKGLANKGLLYFLGIDRPYFNSFDYTVTRLFEPFFEARRTLMYKIEELSVKLRIKEQTDAQFYADRNNRVPKSAKRKALERNLREANQALNALDVRVSDTILTETRRCLHHIYNPQRSDMTREHVQEVIKNECERRVGKRINLRTAHRY